MGSGNTLCSPGNGQFPRLRQRVAPPGAQKDGSARIRFASALPLRAIHSYSTSERVPARREKCEFRSRRGSAFRKVGSWMRRENPAPIRVFFTTNHAARFCLSVPAGVQGFWLGTLAGCLGGWSSGGECSREEAPMQVSGIRYSWYLLMSLILAVGIILEGIRETRRVCPWHALRGGVNEILLPGDPNVKRSSTGSTPASPSRKEHGSN